MSARAKTFQASHFAAALLGGTALAGLPGTAFAQDDVEPATIVSYIQLRPGQPYTAAAADQALKDLAATELFSDFRIQNNNGDVVITVVENPVINRIVLEGNRRLKDDKILPEIKLAPRQIFTRSKVRADVARIIELYKRQGRFAATVEPQMVQLDQNRVDVVFEINEGPKSKVRAINIIGNEAFSDGELRGEMVTKVAGITKILSSTTSYDPDRLAYDQQQLRAFYLSQGYADFRMVSAVAELTPDKRDFIITFVVEEGERYKFGEVSVESQLRDFDSGAMTRALPMKTGDWFDGKLVEDTIEQLTETAGTFGYAFADVNPDYEKSRENLTMDVKFVIEEAPRVYVERVDVNGNTLTQDKVVRREFRINEGDAFNSLQVKRSTARINALGYFQENFEVEQVDGSAPDRIILEANVQEQATGELSLSAGFSSLEQFVFQGSIRQNNFRGRGQTVGLGVNYSSYSRSFNVSFTEPNVFDRNISAGIDLYRTDYNNGYYDRATATYEQATTGLTLRAGVPLTENMSFIARYMFKYDDVTLDQNQYYADFDGDGVRECEPLLAGRYLCEAVGQRTTSLIGGSLIYDTLDNRVRPTRGETASIGLDFAGLGGDTRYVRATAQAAKFWPLGRGFIFSLSGQTGVIYGLRDAPPGSDDVLLTDRFFLSENDIRGFDIRGVGPRVVRRYYDTSDPANPVLFPIDDDTTQDDSLGGTAMYVARAEIEIPMSSGIRELGIRPSLFLDVGSVFGVERPILTNSPYPNGIFIPTRDANGNALYTQIDAATVINTVCTPTASSVVTNPINPNPPACLPSTNNSPIGSSLPPFVEEFYGNTWKPRVSAGVGVNWNSPFGPFRINIAYDIVSYEGDDPKLFSFSVGTQF